MPNREQRRHPKKNEDPRVQPPERPQSAEHDIVKSKTQDVQSVRAKGSGHGKKTADKWNQ